MNEEIKWLYKDEVILDLPTYRESTEAIYLVSAKRSIWGIACILLMTYCFSVVLSTPSMSLSVLTGLVIGGAISLIPYLRNRNGGKPFQDILAANGGKPAHMILLFAEECIHTHNVYKNTDRQISYSQIIKMIDTGRFFVLIDSTHFLVVDLRWLTGGSRDALAAFLCSKCANVKKGIQKTTFGRIMSYLYRGIGILVVAVVLIGSVRQLLPNHSLGMLSDQLSVREIAAVLEDLDIHCQETHISQVEQWEADYAESSMPSSSGGRVLSLLSIAGYGNYDWDTWEWTPPDSGVYWLDLEAFDIEHMYTQYLTGIAAISDGKLVITDIEENHDNVDWESGTGEVTLSFTVNGTANNLIIPLTYDWYDTASLDEINRILNAQHTGRQIYVASDSGQGILLFYRSPQWAKEFNNTTGIPLHKTLSALWSGPFF